MDLLAALRERILAFAASRYGRQIAEDVAQEVLIVIHEKYSHLTRAEDLLPVALKITRFKMMAMARKSQRRGEGRTVDVDEMPLADHTVDLALEAEQKELVAQLERSLPLLGERCRELFRLKLEGKTFPEIQVALSAASINTVYTWDHRCREELRTRMSTHLSTNRRPN
jgi:RNA polymerase sigma-70 factor, ECF subfamily